MWRPTDRQLAWFGICVSTAGASVSVEIFQFGHYYVSPFIFFGLLGVPQGLRVAAGTRPWLGKALRLGRATVLWRLLELAEYGVQVVGVLLVWQTARFLYNYLVTNVFQGTEIFLNVLTLNLMALLLTVARFRRSKLTPLLMRERDGRPHTFIYRGGELRHIPDDLTFFFLGYSYSDVEAVPADEFTLYREGAPLPKITDMEFWRPHNAREVYAIVLGERRHVPNSMTMAYLQKLKGSPIEPQEASPEQVRAVPEGPPLRSILDM